MSSPRVPPAPSNCASVPSAEQLAPLPEEARKVLIRAGELLNLHRYLKDATQKNRAQFAQLAALNQQVTQKSEQLQHEQQAHAADKAEWAQLTEKWSRERESWSQQLSAYASGKEALARQQAEHARERELLGRQQAEHSKDKEGVSRQLAELTRDKSALAAQQEEVAKQQASFDTRQAELVRQRQEIEHLQDQVTQESKSLAGRRAELDEQHEACCRLQADLAVQWSAILHREAEVARAQEERGHEVEESQADLVRQRQEFTEEKEDWQRQKAELEQVLAAQVEELAQQRTAPEQVQADPAGQPVAAVPGDPEELAALRARLQERDQELEDLKLAQAREKKNYESQRQALRDEIKSLRSQLDEELSLIERLQRQQPTVAEAAQEPEAPNMVAYAAELNEFRQQLAADRRELEAELEELRESRSGLAVRESAPKNERAQFSHNRDRLDRMRDQVRMEMERERREGKPVAADAE